MKSVKLNRRMTSINIDAELLDLFLIKIKINKKTMRDVLELYMRDYIKIK